MASTNKTSNYELSQFLGTDKPAWLTDYNSDMSKIDAGIHTAQGTATTADGKADSANSSIGTLSNLTTEAKTNVVNAINEVDSHADTAQGTANSASSNALNALGKADDLIAYLNLNTETALTWTSTVGSVYVYGTKVVKNSSGTLCKIYGEVDVQGINQGGTMTLTSSDTGLRPESDININGCALLRQHLISSNDYTTSLTNYTLKTNGTISITANLTSDINAKTWMFIATLVFVKDFGD